MLPIKRLYTFIYETFIPVFIMTFGICLFIFMIQFLWQYIADFVGKGLDTSIILELFFFLSLSLIPRVLPLAILLASLMTFGNLGERLELLAIKASGVSLLKIMRPMIVLVFGLAIGCFYFQSTLNPKFTVKVTSLLYSIRMASPDLDIPEGSFYSLKGYSIYVKEKDKESRMLRDVIIYDTSKRGTENMSVDVCDSAFMQVADSRDYITITMYNGEHFQNMSEDAGFDKDGKRSFVPYMRESFLQKAVIIPIDEEFERTEESKWDNTHIAKNIGQLRHSVDSMSMTLDSLNRIDRENVARQPYMAHRTTEYYKDSIAKLDSIVQLQGKLLVAETGLVLDFDSVYNTFARAQKSDVLSTALSESRGQSGSHLMYYHIDIPKPILRRDVRNHEIAWHRMFSIPFSCLVFFFIGAPLGSIIRKGGLGVPVIISVLLYISYYILYNIGFKMARDAVWPIWQGVWLGESVLFALGIFLTYKSTKESALFAPEKYKFYFRRILFLKDVREDLFVFEGDSVQIPSPELVTTNSRDLETFRSLAIDSLFDMVSNFREYGHDEQMRMLSISVLHEKGYDVTELVNDRGLLAMKEHATQFAKASLWAIGAFFATLALFVGAKLGGVSLSALFIIPYGVLFIRGLNSYLEFYSKVKKRNKVISYLVHFLLIVLTAVAYPILFFAVKRNMSKQMKKREESSFHF